MADASENTGQMMMLLGELRGQVRELVHGINNLRRDVGTALDRTAATQGLVSAVADIKADVAALDARVTALEAAEHRRTGAIGLSAWVFKTVPFAAFGGGLVAAWKVMGL
jgi:hypothetical protein